MKTGSPTPEPRRDLRRRDHRPPKDWSPGLPPAGPGSSELTLTLQIDLLVRDDDRRGALRRRPGPELGRPDQQRGRIVETSDAADVHGPVAERVHREGGKDVAGGDAIHV